VKIQTMLRVTKGLNPLDPNLKWVREFKANTLGTLCDIRFQFFFFFRLLLLVLFLFLLFLLLVYSIGIDEQNKRKARPVKYVARRESVSYPDMPYEEIEEEVVKARVVEVC
jgi:hypothetical protein